MAPTVNQVAHGVVGIPLFVGSLITIWVFWQRRNRFPIAGRVPVLAAIGSLFAALTAFSYDLSAFTGRAFKFPWLKTDPAGTCLYTIPISHALSSSVFIAVIVRCWMLLFKAQASRADLRASMAAAAKLYSPGSAEDGDSDQPSQPAPYQCSADAIVRAKSLWNRMAYLGSDRFAFGLVVFLTVAFVVYPALDFAFNPDHDPLCEGSHTVFILTFVTILHIGGALFVLVFCVVLVKFNDGLGVRSEFILWFVFAMLGGSVAHRLESQKSLVDFAHWLAPLAHYGFVYATIWRPLLRSNHLPVRDSPGSPGVGLGRGSRGHSRSHSGVAMANTRAPSPSLSAASDPSALIRSGEPQAPFGRLGRASSPSRAAEAPVNGVAIDTIFSAPRLAMSLLEHAIGEFSGENVLFILEIHGFTRAVRNASSRGDLLEATNTARRLFDTYVRKVAPKAVSFSEPVYEATREGMAGLDKLRTDIEDSPLSLEDDKAMLLDLFARAFDEARRLVERDTWQRFILGKDFEGQYGRVLDA